MNRLEAIEQEFGFAEQTGRWRAEKGEHYWYINTLFEATKGTERGNKANDIHFNSGNYFATYEKAAITATRMQKDIGWIAEDENGKYKKHFIGLSDNVTYVVEDITDNDVSKYKYTLNFNPKMWIPFDVKTID